MLWDHVRAGFSDELAKIKTAAVDLRGLSPETLLAQQPPQPMMTVGYDKAKAILDRASMLKTAGSRHVQRALPTQPGIGKLIHQGDDSANERAKSVAGYGLAGIGTAKAVHGLYSSAPQVHEMMRDPALSAAQRFKTEHFVNNLGHGMMLGGAALGMGYGALRAHQKRKAKLQAQNPKTMTKLSAAKCSRCGETTHLGKSTSFTEEGQQKVLCPHCAGKVKQSTMTSPAHQLKAAQQTSKPSMAPSAAGPSTTSQIGGSLIGRKFVPGA
jgi:DNA-directed RNA polymerase subunit RPC12/RpoP